jgi:acetyl-CoA C-acetyltransferase
MRLRPVPVLVGASQFTQPKDAVPALDPLGLMIRTSRNAFADAGTNELPRLIDTICVVNSFSHDDENTPHILGKALGIKPREAIYSLIGGNTPQMLVNRLSRDIAAGRRRAVLICGAEAIYAMNRHAKGKFHPDWQDNRTFRQLQEMYLPANFDALLHLGCDREKKVLDAQGNRYEEPNNRVEAAYDLFMPQFMYPFFETALRSFAGRTPEEHRRHMGRLCAHLSRIASQNPHAWYRRRLSADDITTPTPQNRYVVYPYTLRMMANINVDQSAALIMMAEQDARAFGIDRSRWVYPMGGAELNNIWHVTQRPQLHDSPAITEASRLSLKQAGLALHDIGAFDLYSCFPSAVEISRQAIGIPENDPRDLSVTGGLAYFGGPGNSYTMHAIVSTVERIRKDHRLKVMVTANGWFNSKHAIGIYGAKPPETSWEDRDDSAIQRAIDAEVLTEPVERAAGVLTVRAYSLRYNTEGKPERATVIGQLQNGLRALADIKASPNDLLKLEQIEIIGETGEVRFDPIAGRNRLTLSTHAFNQR